MGASKILLIGGTGYMGKYVVNASMKLGHPTFVLVRTKTPAAPAKVELLKSFTNAGATLVVGDLGDHASLVAALKQVDVVISIVGDQLGDQHKILEAAKEVGTIKRFIPSEFGNDVDRVEFEIPLTARAFGAKQEFRRLIEKSDIPYTYIVSGSFAGYYLAPIVQDLYAPPRDGKLEILGDGNANAIFNDETDIGTFTIKAVDDPRAANKSLHIIPKENVASTNEVIALWEKKIGHTFEKEFVSKEVILQQIDELPAPHNFLRAIKYSVFFKGDQTGFALDPSKDVEATVLYPDVKYTSIDEYLTRLV